MTDFTSIGTQFVQHYYQTFDTNRPVRILPLTYINLKFQT